MSSNFEKLWDGLVHSKTAKAVVSGAVLTSSVAGCLPKPAEVAPLPSQTPGIGEYAKFYSRATYGVGPLSKEFGVRESVCKSEFEKNGKPADVVVLEGKVKDQKDGFALWFCRSFKDESRTSYSTYLMIKDSKSTEDNMVFTFNKIYKLENKVTGEILLQTEYGIPLVSIGPEEYTIYGKNKSVMATGKVDDDPGSIKALFALMPVETPTSKPSVAPEKLATATATFQETLNAYNTKTATANFNRAKATATETPVSSPTGTATVVAETGTPGATGTSAGGSGGSDGEGKIEATVPSVQPSETVVSTGTVEVVQKNAVELASTWNEWASHPVDVSNMKVFVESVRELDKDAEANPETAYPIYAQNIIFNESFMDLAYCLDYDGGPYTTEFHQLRENPNAENGRWVGFGKSSDGGLIAVERRFNPDGTKIYITYELAANRMANIKKNGGNIGTIFEKQWRTAPYYKVNTPPDQKTAPYLYRTYVTDNDAVRSLFGDWNGANVIPEDVQQYVYSPVMMTVDPSHWWLK